MFLRCLFHVFASFLCVALRNGWMGEWRSILMIGREGVGYRGKRVVHQTAPVLTRSRCFFSFFGAFWLHLYTVQFTCARKSHRLPAWCACMHGRLFLRFLSNKARYYYSLFVIGVTRSGFCGCACTGRTRLGSTVPLLCVAVLRDSNHFF